jgi:hypothetical protein
MVVCYNLEMITKHFFKILVLFIGMITLGLLGVFLVNYFDLAKQEELKKTESLDITTKVKMPEGKVNFSSIRCC